VSVNETLGTINFSTEWYLCTECRQMKHSVQCYFLPSVSYVPSGAFTNNQFNVVVYQVQICTECMRQKHSQQCSFLLSVCFLPECFTNGTLSMSWNTVNRHQEAICTECFVKNTWYKIFIPSVLFIYQMPSVALGKLLCKLSARYKTLSTDRSTRCIHTF
jgi:hypothetical protein